MTNEERQEILEKSKIFFREKIATNHRENTEKLKDLSCFTINPFLHKYLANFAFGEATPENMAKVLVYPRALGTSISTTFGTQLQQYCSEVLTSFGSAIPGIDIEFIDTIDGRKKYCQVKAGPNTINKDDVKTIIDHFTGIRNLARTNHLAIRSEDCIVGVFYGTRAELSSNYKKIDESYPVFVGQEFWYRLTGEENFYEDLINTFAEVADEVNGTEVINEAIRKVAESISHQ